MRRSVLLAAVILTSLTTFSGAQDSAPATAPRPIRLAGPLPAAGVPRVLIDGATNPDAISDASVITQAIHLWQTPAGADDAGRRRLSALTGRMRLGPADTHVLQQEMARAHALMAPRDAQLQGSRTYAEAHPAQQAIRAIPLETHGRLRDLLSPDGRQKLQAHIQYMKTRTKVVTSVPAGLLVRE